MLQQVQRPKGKLVEIQAVCAPHNGFLAHVPLQGSASCYRFGTPDACPAKHSDSTAARTLPGQMEMVSGAGSTDHGSCLRSTRYLNRDPGILELLPAPSFGSPTWRGSF